MIIGQFDEKSATATMVLKGRFDYSCQQEFREFFARYPKGTDYIIDLSSVSYIDSSALGMLLLLRDHAGGDTSNVVIKGASEFVISALKMAHFERLFVLS
ncbi:STAS domain-containing protein [Marinomonas fungiae]|uniref:Anti-anti-sigma regulatory factor (Antagonist of anti-sigma factor) n=1 Tax=Marinomonas fungiae TaxID=1137284 RepID=A0A0K6IIT3_9GAMM|nr:STAS domain-containing protein [Marinomonas fungiae]CUB03014.1 Anti-anti-sigma regulatory factor (antagonist of anti-sigma factor) [Marinomonas fungiae]